MSSSDHRDNNPTQYRDSTPEYARPGGERGQHPSVPANPASPYAQPPGRWEYVPYNAQDAQQQVQAEKSSEASLVLGILGVVILPILAPFALWQAYKSEKLGGRATTGKVLGWVGVVLLILGILSAIAFFALFGVVLNESQNTVNSFTV